jgi:cytochrome P450
VAEKQRRALAIFGQGAHTCPGRHLAWLEIKAILTRVLRDFDGALAPQDLEANVYDPVGRPADEARILVIRRASAGKRRQTGGGVNLEVA